MELSLSEQDPFNAVFLTPDGSAIYHTDTPLTFFSTRHTTINKLSRDGPQQMAVVEVHGWSDSIVNVWGRSFRFLVDFIRLQSESFCTASIGIAS